MIRIHYEKKNFEISCKFYEKDVVAALPSRRYLKSRKIWKAPAVRANIDILLRWKGIEWSPGAQLFLKEYFEKKNIPKEPFPQGFPFKTEPREYQRKGLDKIYYLHNSALFMDPGTGKTKMAIDMAAARHMSGKIDQVVVIGLVSIKTNWQEEIEKHCAAPFDTHVLYTDKKGITNFNKFNAGKGFKWLILGSESLSSGKAYEMVEQFITKGNTMVIVDESTKIKNHKAIRTDRAISLGKMPNSHYRLIMTGTPLTQGVIDLFSQFEFLDTDIIGIGNYYAFRNTYCVMGGFQKRQIFGYKNIPQLTSLLEPYVYQVRKREVLKELPAFTREVRKVTMTPEQTKLYQELKKNLRVMVDNKELTVTNVMNLQQRFAEITGGHISYETENPDPLKKESKPWVYERKRLKKSPKLDELISIVEDLPKDEAVIIWSPSIAEIKMITEKLTETFKEEVGVLTGKASEKERQDIRTRFQAGSLRFIVGNPSVGGIGLNLTAACYVIYYRRDFSLEINIQSEARVDRIGQTRAITYFDIVCEKTVDEYILEIINKKENLSEIIRSAFRNNPEKIIDLF